MYADPTLDTKPDALSKRGGAFYSEAAVDLLASLHGDLGEVQVVNVRNDGTLPFLADDAVIEVPAIVDAAGVPPAPLRAPVEPLYRGLIAHVSAYEELAVEAAIKGGVERVPPRCSPTRWSARLTWRTSWPLAGREEPRLPAVGGFAMTEALASRGVRRRSRTQAACGPGDRRREQQDRRGTGGRRRAGAGSAGDPASGRVTGLARAVGPSPTGGPGLQGQPAGRCGAVPTTSPPTSPASTCPPRRRS